MIPCRGGVATFALPERRTKSSLPLHGRQAVDDELAGRHSCVLSTLLAVVSHPAEQVELRLAALAALERQPASEAVAMEVCLHVGDDNTLMADAASSTTTAVHEQLKQLGPATTVERHMRQG